MEGGREEESGEGENEEKSSKGRGGREKRGVWRNHTSLSHSLLDREPLITHASLSSESEVFGKEPILAKEKSDPANSIPVQNSLLVLQKNTHMKIAPSCDNTTDLMKICA